MGERAARGFRFPVSRSNARPGPGRAIFRSPSECLTFSRQTLAKFRIASLATFAEIGLVDRMQVIEGLLDLTRQISARTGHIERLKALIPQLRQDGGPTAEAEALLKQLERSQAIQKAERDRLARDLERLTRFD